MQNDELRIYFSHGLGHKSGLIDCGDSPYTIVKDAVEGFAAKYGEIYYAGSAEEEEGEIPSLRSWGRKFMHELIRGSTRFLKASLRMRPATIGRPFPPPRSRR